MCDLLKFLHHCRKNCLVLRAGLLVMTSYFLRRRSIGGRCRTVGLETWDGMPNVLQGDQPDFVVYGLCGGFEDALLGIPAARWPSGEESDRSGWGSVVPTPKGWKRWTWESLSTGCTTPIMKYEAAAATRRQWSLFITLFCPWSRADPLPCRVCMCVMCMCVVWMYCVCDACVHVQPAS